MVLPKFEYLRPDSIEEANRLLIELGDGAKVMSGGTDLIVLMKDKVIKPAYLVDIKRIPGMDYLDYDPTEGLKIGALTKLRTIESSALVKEKYPALAAAAHYVASTQVRAKGTLAGNICNASPSADTAPILIALGATIMTQGVEESRKIPAGEFFVGPKRTVLQQGEIVTQIIIPPMQENQRAAYIKLAVRKAMDLAIVGVAASLTMDGDVCAGAHIVLGAVAATPIRAPKAEAVLKGKKLTEDVITEAGIAASGDCNPISDVRASAEYRKDMVRVFTKRTIHKALETR